MLADELFDSLKREGQRLQGRDPDRVDFSVEPTIEFLGKAYPLHAGQKKVWASKARHVAAIAGRQSGKTALLPYLALREIQLCGGGDGLIVGPSYPLMDRRLVPECERVWVGKYGLGEYKVGRRTFEFSAEGLRKLGVPQAVIYFGFAEDPESLESMQAMWCCRDETGQSKFSRAAAEAIDGRLSVGQGLGFGRIFDSTTPYEAGGWFQEDVWDKRDSDPNIEVVSYRSTDNPAFSKEVFEELRGKMPAWKFSMMYEGQYTRPAGAVYDNFDRKTCVVPRFTVPPGWKRYYGIDFGQVHTAVVCFAEHPTEKDLEGYPVLYAYHEHFPNKASYVYQHVKALKAMEDALLLEFLREGTVGGADRAPVRGIGGASSENDPRWEWTGSGIPVEEPWVKSVETGIDRVYACIARGGFKVMDSCVRLVKQMESYSWELDDKGEAIPGKLKDKTAQHLADAVRYAVCQLRPNKTGEANLTSKLRFGEVESVEDDWDAPVVAAQQSMALTRRNLDVTQEREWA